jgi:hypothetical protein
VIFRKSIWKLKTDYQPQWGQQILTNTVFQLMTKPTTRFVTLKLLHPDNSTSIIRHYPLDIINHSELVSLDECLPVYYINRDGFLLGRKPRDTKHGTSKIKFWKCRHDEINYYTTRENALQALVTYILFHKNHVTDYSFTIDILDPKTSIITNEVISPIWMDNIKRIKKWSLDNKMQLTLWDNLVSAVGRLKEDHPPIDNIVVGKDQRQVGAVKSLGDGVDLTCNSRVYYINDTVAVLLELQYPNIRIMKLRKEN